MKKLPLPRRISAWFEQNLRDAQNCAPGTAIRREVLKRTSHESAAAAKSVVSRPEFVRRNGLRVCHCNIHEHDLLNASSGKRC
jgi:hypothetical protein